jgi:hypothetical protein
MPEQARWEMLSPESRDIERARVLGEFSCNPIVGMDGELAEAVLLD